MSMQRDIQHGRYYLVETSQGTELVPYELVGGGNVRFALRQFVEGKINSFSERSGWYGRYSMPGYLDCTDWTWADSEKELIEELDGLYGESDDSSYRYTDNNDGTFTIG